MRDGGLIMKVTLEDGIFAMVRIDPRSPPRVSELIGIFSTTSPARSYAEGEADLSVDVRITRSLQQPVITLTEGNPS